MSRLTPVKVRSRPNALKMSRRLRREVQEFLNGAPIEVWNREHCKVLARLLFDHAERELTERSPK